MFRADFLQEKIEDALASKEGGARIRSLIANFDALSGVERLLQQTISVNNAEAAFVKSRQNHEIQESQNRSDIAAADKLPASTTRMNVVICARRSIPFASCSILARYASTARRPANLRRIDRKLAGATKENRVLAPPPCP